MDFVDRVVALHDSLAGSGIPHAFGGALALAYHATPRGTVEIDLNVFLPIGDAAEVIEQLTASGIEPPPRGIDGALPTAGPQCPGDDTHVDLSFSYDTEFFASVRDRVEAHTFEDSRRRYFDLPFLSAEGLCVVKVTCDRLRDRADIEAMLVEAPLDLAYVERWLLHHREDRTRPSIQHLKHLSDAAGAHRGASDPI